MARVRGAAAALLGAAACTALLVSLPSHGGAQPAAGAKGAPALLQSGLAFEPNAGRFDARVRWLARGPGYTVFLTRGEAVTSLSGGRAVLRTRLLGASRASGPRGRARLPGTVSSFVGVRSRWRSALPTYGRVVYTDVYPGIDLAYHGRAGALEYDFNVAPGADPSRIALAVGGARGLRLDRGGDLVIPVRGGTLREPQPFAYQVRDGFRRRVAAAWRLDDGRLAFRLGRYDRNVPLVIDPVLQWATYAGGSNNEDNLNAVKLGSDGSLYVVGESEST